MPTVVISLHGGLVQHVASDVHDLRVLIADHDVEGTDEGDLFTHDVTGPFVLTEEIATAFRPDDLAIIETADADPHQDRPGPPET